MSKQTPGTIPFSVFDRFALLQLLPDKGNFVTLRVIHELQQELSLSEEEISAFEVIVDNASGRVTWNQQATEAAGPKEVSISPIALMAILDKAQELDRREVIPANWFDLLVRLGYQGIPEKEE